VRAILSYGFYSALLYYYLAGLFEILIYPKGFLLWPLIGTEKVRNSPLAPGWYRESSILESGYGDKRIRVGSSLP
jgi:hypothetical protein